MEKIYKLEKVSINNSTQWILVKGSSNLNPLILFLHGGPGSPEMLLHKYQKRLEENFLVVNWDQRGAGKSFTRKTKKESLNINQYIEDAHQLVLYLRAKYEKRKIFLIGHSFGSYLGMKLISKYPDLFHAYIGVGQVVHWELNEERSYQRMLHYVKRMGDIRGLKALKEIGLPPFKSKYPDFLKWAEKYRGSLYQDNIKFRLGVFSKAITSGVYRVKDYIKFIIGKSVTMKSPIWKELQEVDLFKEIPKVEVPVYFFTGESDLCTMADLAEDYFEYLDAPEKKFVWFMRSSHSPHIEEPKEFCNQVLSCFSRYNGL